MANTKNGNGGLSKAEAIRRGLRQYPDKGPTEVAQILTKRHGTPFSAKHVSVVKTKMRAAESEKTQGAAARRTATAPSPSASAGVAELVTTLKTYVQRVGKDDLHRIVDAL